MSDKDDQRRDLGRVLRAVGELLEDDDKRARFEATARELRERIEANPSLAIEFARQLAERLGRRKG